MSSGAGHSGDSAQSGKCAHCGAQLRPPLLHCARCKSEHYCSKACQILAWKAGHKNVCMHEGGAAGETGSHKKAGSSMLEDRGQSRAGTDTFRFQVGTRVQCIYGQPVGHWEEGRVVKHHYEQPRGVFHPYQIRLDRGDLICAPRDDDRYIKSSCKPELLSADARDLIRRECSRGEGSRQGGGTTEAEEDVDLQQAQSALTAGESEMIVNLMELHTAENWRGIMELEQVASSAIAHLQATRPDSATKICFMLGDAYYGLRLLESPSTHGSTITRAINVFEKALENSKGIGNREGWTGQAMACVQLGRCYVWIGDQAKAIELLEQSEAIFEELGDWSDDLQSFGDCYRSFGMIGKAIELYEQDHAIAVKTGNRARMSVGCFNLGLCHKELGENHTAIELLETSRDIAGR